VYECLSFTQTKPVSFDPSNDDVPELMQQSSSKIQVFYGKQYKEEVIHATFYLLPQALEFIEQVGKLRDILSYLQRKIFNTMTYT
jgi:hypothetical protein